MTSDISESAVVTRSALPCIVDAAVDAAPENRVDSSPVIFPRSFEARVEAESPVCSFPSFPKFPS